MLIHCGWILVVFCDLASNNFIKISYSYPDMLTSDDRKEVDLHLKRGSIARGVFRDILELEILKICHNTVYRENFAPVLVSPFSPSDIRANLKLGQSNYT